MRPEELFENFDADKQARYEAELVRAVRRGGHAAHRREQAPDVGLDARPTPSASASEWQAFGPQLVELIEAGASVDDPRVQDGDRGPLPLGVPVLDA